MKLKRLSILLGTPVLGMALGIGPACAVQPDAGSTLETLKDRPLAPMSSPQVIDKPRDQQETTARDSGGAIVKVAAFSFEGNTHFSREQLLPVVAAYQGKSLTLGGLREAAGKVKVFYRSNGYFLAQAFIPDQDVKSGNIKILVVEGKIGKVTPKMAAAARLRESVARNLLSALPPGTPITESTIEKPLLLLNDLPGMRVKSTLKPGAGLGEADLDVEVSDDGRRLTGSVELDNWGNRNTGKMRLSGTINGQNLSGYGDLLSLRALLAEDGGTTLGRLSYTLPVGPLGTKITASYSDLAYTLGESFAYLNADGTGQVYSLLAQHPIIRSRNQNVFFVLGLDRKDLTDNTTNGASVEKRRVQDVRVGLLGDFRDDLAGGALNTFSAYVIGGDLDIRSATPLSIDQSTSGYKTNGNFAKFNFAYQRLQRITDQTSLLVATSGQFASKNLSPAEQFSLGGPSGVRAHPVGEGAGDDAMMLTLEARHTLPGVRLAGTPLQLSVFADVGHSKVHHNPLSSDTNNTHNLQGYGVGVNISKQGDYLLRLDWAFRSGEKSSDDDQPSRFWAQAIKWF